MPIKLPKLDDRTYADLVEEGLTLIPTHAPEWTNHNPSDPGITLVEVFAYFTELLNYRLDRIGKAEKLAFLRLLNGPAWQPPAQIDLTVEVRKAILALRRRNRAVTCEDTETLALEADDRIARAHCVPRRDLSNPMRRTEDRPGRISVVVVPGEAITDPLERAALFTKVEAYFEDKRLLTTRIHAVGPGYLGGESGITIRLAAMLKPGALDDTLAYDIPLGALDLDGVDPSTQEGAEEMLTQLLASALADPEFSAAHTLSDELRFRILADKRWLIIDNGLRQTYTVRQEDASLYLYKDALRAQAMRALYDYFDPLNGGPEGAGWPFGRDVYVPELYQIVDRLPGVDYVTKLWDADTAIELDELSVLDPAYADRVRRNDAGRLIALEVAEHELVRLAFDQIYITVQRAAVP